MVMTNRGSLFGDVEKCSLLLKAMDMKEAQNLVHRSSAGGKDYAKAVEALKENYDSAHVIYPTLVRTLTDLDQIDYNRKGL